MPTTRSASRSRDTVSPAFSNASDTIIVGQPSTPLRSTRSSSRRPSTPGPGPAPEEAHTHSMSPRHYATPFAGASSGEVLTPIRRSLRSSSVTPVGSPLPPSAASSSRKPPSSSRRAGSHALSVEPDSISTRGNASLEVEVEIPASNTPTSSTKTKTPTKKSAISISTPTPLDLTPTNSNSRVKPTSARRTPRSTPTPTRAASGISKRGPDSARSTGTTTTVEKTDSMITDDLLGGHTPIQSPSSSHLDQAQDGDEEQSQTPTRSTRSTTTKKPARHSAHRRTALDLLVEDSEKILGETVDELKEDWEEEEGEDGMAAHTRSHDSLHGHPHGHHEHQENVGAAEEDTGEVHEEEEEVGGDVDEDLEEVQDGEATPRALEVVLEEDELEDEDEEENDDDEAVEIVDSEDNDSAEEKESSESEDESDSDDNDDSEDSEDSEDDPELFLTRALQSAQRSKHTPAATQAGEANKAVIDKTTNEEDDDVWILDPEAKAREEKRRRERPIPGLTIPKTSGIPLHNLSLGPQDRLGKKRAEREERKRVQAAAEAEAREKMGSDVKGKGKERESLEDVVRRGVEVDDAKFEKPLSRKEKLKLPDRKTVSQAWSSLPTIPSALLPQMRRDYQAMHLRDSLDPKRFMKGKVKSTVPENFAIGTLIAPPRHLQSTTLTRERTYNPGDIVQSIVNDSDLGGYAKRKFDDFAGKRMEHGKGKGWKKRKGEGW